ncbi:hypothetical protein KAFR_0F02400 [Kazachstania africana CBS 2517]|uniref:ADP-ribose 1''-phosphate phosphatase n=1 Tax=Kazachstania africana (strain ATCC 22294 / BCRC 22015 / CBS 2517 / CECT 1963 / NBRC 1671 / NRRL Y-8276) TaxID=1071382 RepID=H2AWT7_KAZAF|nr:hypothetical protein KAFR_0F02400 [Kazachstania africana CBS 2517]CCF58837.1 hypothetical protein KAFR_0F02400 [Kazachstania africana CBS 2517]
MTNLKYVKGDILKKTSYPRLLIHSCNCNGSWGGGIAYQLAVNYPLAEREYVGLCEENGSDLLGKCKLIPSYTDDNLIIACLFTSSYGGSSHDSAESILKYTKQALDDLSSIRLSSKVVLTSKTGKQIRDYNLEMPKINSGIFGVPWKHTEELLRAYKNEMNFTVYVL